MSHDVNVCRQETGMQCTTNVHTVSAYDHKINYGHTFYNRDSPLIGPRSRYCPRKQKHAAQRIRIDAGAPSFRYSRSVGDIHARQRICIETE